MPRRCKPPACARPSPHCSCRGWPAEELPRRQSRAWRLQPGQSTSHCISISGFTLLACLVRQKARAALHPEVSCSLINFNEHFRHQIPRGSSAQGVRRLGRHGRVTAFGIYRQYPLMAPGGYPILSSYPPPILVHHTEPLTGQPLYNSRHVTQGQRQRWPVLEQAFGSARRKATCLWESGPDTSSGLKSVLGPSWPRWRRRGVDHDGDYKTAGPPSYPSSVSPVPQYVKPPQRDIPGDQARRLFNGFLSWTYDAHSQIIEIVRKYEIDAQKLYQNPESGQSKLYDWGTPNESQLDLEKLKLPLRHWWRNWRQL